jgi:hypothetical protein
MHDLVGALHKGHVFDESLALSDENLKPISLFVVELSILINARAGKC